jgi:ribosomal small subunit protein bTHX
MHLEWGHRESFPEGMAMGKGDLRTRRGKIYNGSYGKKRPHRAPKKKAGETRLAGRRPTG